MLEQERSNLAVTWLGHATALVELDGLRLLTDPILRERVGPLVRLAPPASAGDRVDAVLLSHLHADHADVRSLRRLGRSLCIVAPRGAARWLARRGLTNVSELVPGERCAIGGVTVTATRAVHDARRWRWLGVRAQPIGFVVEGSHTCYFAGDTDFFPQMSDLTGLIDVALLPISGWGPRLGPGHLDAVRATAAAQIIAPRVVVPIHWGTFALGWPFRAPADPALAARDFARLMRAAAPQAQVLVLAPGERAQLPSATDDGRVAAESI